MTLRSRRAASAARCSWASENRVLTRLYHDCPGDAAMGPGDDEDDKDEQPESNSIADFEQALRDALEDDINEKTGAADPTKNGAGKKK